MKHITLTAEQAKIVLSAGEAHEPMLLRDEQGRTIAEFTPLSGFEIEAVERWKRTRDEPRRPGVPSHFVQAMLRKFHELDAKGELTEEKVEEILRRTQAGEEP